MAGKDVDLIPRKVSDEFKDILGLGVGETVIRFLADEITQMFRELSEHRSMTEVILSVYPLMREVIERHFERQRGKKYL